MRDVPGNWRHAYEEALKQFQAHKNPTRMAENSGAPFQGGEEGYFSLRYCGEDYSVSYPEGRIKCISCQEAEVPKSVQISILLYMVQALPLPKGKEWKTFKDLPQGYHHWMPFVNEALDPLVKGFGSDLASLQKVAQSLGGRPVDIGDLGYEFQMLPRINLQVIFWAGDEEFPPKANILFNESCVMQLDTATLYMLGIDLSRRLLHRAGRLARVGS